MKMRKRKMDKAISTLLTLSLVLGIFSGTLPVYAEEAEPVEVAAQNGPTQYSEDGVSEENISGESLENNGDSLQLASSQPASSQPASLEVSSNEEQTQGGDSDTQSYTAYTTDSLDAVELEDTNELIVTNDAVSQVSSSEDTVISSGSGERPAETAGQVEPILRMAKKNEVAYSPELASQDNQMQQIPSFSTKVPTSISSSSYISTWKETIKKTGSSISNTMTDVSTNFTTKTAKTTYSFKPLIDKVPMYCLTTSPRYFTSTTILHTTFAASTTINNTVVTITIPDVAVTLGIPLTFWDNNDKRGYFLSPLFGVTSDTANTSNVYASTTLPVLTSNSNGLSSYSATFDLWWNIEYSDLYTLTTTTGWVTGPDGTLIPTDEDTNLTTTITLALRTDVDWGWLSATTTATYIGFTVPEPIYKQIIPDERQIRQMISDGKPESGTDVYIDTIIDFSDIYWRWKNDIFYKYWNGSDYNVDYDRSWDGTMSMPYTYYTFSMNSDGSYICVPSVSTYVYGATNYDKTTSEPFAIRAKLGQWFVTTIYEDEIITRTQKLVPTTIYWENEEEVIHSTVLWKYAVIYLPLPVHTDDYPNSSGGGEDISEESVQTGNVTQKPIPMAIKADKPVTQNFTVLNAAVSPKGGGGHAAAGGRHAVATGDESQLYLNLLIFLSSAASLCIWLAMMRKRSTAR